MEKRSPLYTAGKVTLDVIEKYVPIASFCALFVVFMLEIVFRYFFVPLVWSLELSLLTYIWTVLFGVCFAQRDDSHTKFTLIYDMVSPKAKTIMRIAGNLLLAGSFGLAWYPSYQFIAFMGFKKSDVLSIPMNLAFSPFLAFLLIMIVRYCVEIARDIAALAKGEVR